MNYWKLGCRWGSKKDGNPLFFELLLKHKIVLSLTDKDFGGNSTLILTDGHTVIGVAKTTSEGLSAIEFPEFEDEFRKHNIDFSKDLLIYKAEIYTIKKEDSFEYKLVQGICGVVDYDVKDNIKKLIIKYQRNMGIENILTLLSYKKQIILQGPPGTGKTRLAEIIAQELTKEKKEINYYNAIIKFFSQNEYTEKEINFRNAGLKLYSSFRENFEREKLEKLNIDDYIVGKGDTDTFCYWLEFKLKDLGTYSGYSTKFKLFWNDSDQQYGKVGFIKEDNEEVAISKIKEVLLDIYDQENLELASKKMSEAFVLKALNSYYPDKYFPILKRGFIDKSLQLLKVKYGNNSTIFQRNILLQQEFLNLKTKYNSEVSNFEFMHFLFTEFGLKDDLKIENEKITAEGEYKIILFHPNYSYEDFIRGIAATVEDNQIKYSVQNKILVDFIEKAITNKNKNANYVLIIDEINRANLSAVLGELIYALEYRDKVVTGLYDFIGGEENHLKNNDLMLPSNLYIIGTMNTADRSVGHIDYAIRRRFAFVDVLPEKLSNSDEIIFDHTLYESVSKLFVKDFSIETEYNSENIFNNEEYLSNEFSAKDVWLGHSYFIQKIKKDESGNIIEKIPTEMSTRLNYEIKPILMEYIRDGVLKPSAIEVIKNLSV